MGIKSNSLLASYFNRFGASGTLDPGPYVGDIAIAHYSDPCISVYPWTSGTGFGTKYSDPSSLPAANSYGSIFSPDGANIACTTQYSPYVTAYPWSSGFGTKYSDPSTLPAGYMYDGIAFTPDGADLATCHAGSPYLSVYPWTSGTGFGTKYSNPSTLPGGENRSLAFTPAAA